ncbi:helix-turn-helix domain-containing protein [Mesorhizobium sp. ASY16-5R]|uniref:helix-turn-helix domain-containing protein n=1 Tax=Mesorhizobium sp. ASY16-5R TaxID=3445772 RepID=UPI003F9F61EE
MALIAEERGAAGLSCKDAVKQVLLTQTGVGTMASASRRQVNAALKRFAEFGWLTTNYDAITVLNAEALRLFGDEVVIELKPIPVSERSCILGLCAHSSLLPDEISP